MKPVQLGKPLNAPTQITKLRYSPCGKSLFAGGFNGQVLRWNVEDTTPKEQPAFMGHNGFVSALAFHSNRVYTSDTWGALHCHNYISGNSLWKIEQSHTGWVRSIALSRTGNIATCGRDHHLKIWSESGKLLHETKLDSEPFCLAFHSSGHLYCGNLLGNLKEFDDKLKLVRSASFKDFYLLDRIQDVGGIRGIGFQNADQVVIHGAIPKTGGFVQAFPFMQVLDVKTLNVQHTWKGATDNEGFVHDVCWLKDGSLAAVTSGQPGQGSLMIWKTQEAQPSFVAKLPNCHSVTLHPMGKQLAIAFTNANSSGNGRVKGKDGDYPVNFSPVQLWQFA